MYIALMVQQKDCSSTVIFLDRRRTSPCFRQEPCWHMVNYHLKEWLRCIKAAIKQQYVGVSHQSVCDSMQSEWHSVWDKVVINLISQWKLPAVANLLPSKPKETHIHYLRWKCSQYKLKLRNSSTNSDVSNAGQGFNGKNDMRTQQLCFYSRILPEYNLLESSLVESPVANRCMANELCSSTQTQLI